MKLMGWGIMVLMIATGNIAFCESFGIFKSEWNTFKVNKPLVATFEGYRSMSSDEKARIKSAIERYRSSLQAKYTPEMSSRSLTQLLLDFGDYDNSLRSGGDQIRCLNQLMQEPVKIHKTATVLLKSLSFKFIDSEFKDWKAALKQEKIRHCAIQADIDWGSAPASAYVYIKLSLYDSDGLYVSSLLGSSFGVEKGERSAHSLTFYPDKSRGAPTRFEFK